MTQKPGSRENLNWRQRMEIVPGRHNPKRVRNGAIFVVGVLIFLWIIYTKPTLPFLGPKGPQYTAEFDYGANVRPGYTPVRVHGVDVGQVEKVKRADNGKVDIKFRILKGSHVTLHEDASLALRWRTLLGRNMYLDVNPGSPSAPKFEGSFFSTKVTSDQVELDTALEPLDASGRKAMQQIITEFDKGTSSPKAIQTAIDNVAPTMKPLANTLEALRGTQPGTDLPVLIASTSQATAALARDERALGGVIDNGDVTLGVTAARKADLADTVNQAPAAMAQTRQTLARLETTLDVLDPLAKKLTPGVGKLDGAAKNAQATLAALVPLTSDLRPTLRALAPAVASLDRASLTGKPAFAPLNTTIQRVRDTFLPWLNDKNVENGRPNYQDVGPAVASVSTATSWGDANGPVANFEAAVGENAFVDSPCTTQLTNPAAAQIVNCEIFSRMLTGLYTGQRPDKVKMKGESTPLSKLMPYFTGEKKLIPNPHLKPLKLKGAK